MNMFMEFFLFFVSILQFLFPFAFKDTEIPVQTTEPVVEETVIPGEHVHTGGNGNCLQSAVCEICGEIYGGEGEHTYTAIVKPATCTQGGFTTYRCRFCLHTEEGDYTEAKGHTYKMKTTQATCTVAGYNVYTCVDCSASRNEEIEPAKGHDYSSVTFSANCTEGYRTVFTCNTCGNIHIEQSADAIGHDYKPIVTAPTCDLGGYTTYSCIRCADSYVDDRVDALGHSFTNYIPDGNATCTTYGTATAYCDNGCGEWDPITDYTTLLAHDDSDKNTHCDDCNEKLYVNYVYLQYPTEALATLGVDVSINDYIGKADKGFGGDDVYAANKGTSYNSIIESPYFTAKVTGKRNGSDAATTEAIPVYGTAVYVGETGKGAIHSFSEVYIKAGEYSTFEVEINTKSGQTAITSAVILPESSGETATVANGTVRAIISGFGAHTFVFNNENQAYAYTITVREDIDEDAEIQALRDDGYDVHVAGNKPGDGYPSYINYYEYLYYTGQNPNIVIYLRKGSVLDAKPKYDINSDYDEFSNLNYQETDPNADNKTGIGQNRFGYLTANGVNKFKILGYGAIDLGRLDRSERRGIIISWANDVEIRGIKLFNAPQWSLIVYNSDNVTIKDVDVMGYRQNSDAFDICNSRNVTVDGCFTRTGDDGFVIKTLGGEAWAVTNNVTVKNSYAWVGKARAFGIFGETNKNISNVTFKDNTVLYHDANWDYLRIPAIGIVVEGDTEQLAQANSGTAEAPRRISNITFENIEICRNRTAAVNAIIYQQVQHCEIDGLTLRNISCQINKNTNQFPIVNTINKFTETGTIRNVIVENIVCSGTRVTKDNFGSFFDPALREYLAEEIK